MKSTTKELIAKMLSESGLQQYEQAVTSATATVCECFANGNRLYVCGNGGRAADCGHIVGEADMLNPDKIVIGGVYMRAHKYMDETMYARLKREALHQTAYMQILPSELGEQIGDFAALSICEM